MKIDQHLIFTILLLAFCKVSFSQAYPDRHSTSLSDGWLSCETLASPNPIRGTGHWIMYDLGDTYALQTSKIWNFNTPERTNSYDNQPWSLTPLQGKLTDGMKDVMIDYSLDGITWTEWGQFSIAQASGSSFYQGVNGPDFEGKIVRYVLITGLKNHGGTCYGLSEVRFNGAIAVPSQTEDLFRNAQISAIPNPFTDFSVVNLNDFPIGDLQMTMTDLMGREVLNRVLKISSKSESISISGNGVPAGLYILKVSNKESSKSIKLEKL